MACTPANTFSGPLVIKVDGSDTGARPRNPCGAYWTNQNIWIEGGVDASTVAVGAVNTVKVRVDNIATNPISDVRVEVWVCDFTLGVKPSSSLNSSNPGGAPMTNFQAGPVAPGNHIDMAVTWTPVASDASINGGHVCVAANCFSEDPVDGQSLGTSDFAFCCDSHHAQKNIAVRQVSQGGGGQMNFHFIGINPALKGEEVFTIALTEVTGPRAFGQIERDFLLRGPLVRVLDHENIRNRPVLLPDRLETIVPPEAISARLPFNHLVREGLLPVKYLQPVRLSRFRPKELMLQGEGFDAGLKARLPIHADQRVDLGLSLRVNPNEPVGSVHVFDLTQSNGGGEVVGGARVITLTTP